MLFQPPFYLYRTIPSILVDSIYKTSQFITSLHRLPTHRVKSFGNLYNSWFLGRINFGPYMNSFIDYIPNVLHWNLEILSQNITIKCAIIPKVSLLRHIYKNVKIFILSFKINIFCIYKHSFGAKILCP